MCGIVGVIAPEPIAERETLLRMRDAMIHRGPDDAGEWWSPDGRVGLAQRRLAILDLSPAGHQPMTDATGTCITFNGEIYNYRSLKADLQARGHRFCSHSDTEVVLAAYREWGEACLHRLQGMFAFGLYDAVRRRVLLARDRAGEKPLFYTERAGRLTFASELKALMADPSFPRRLDRRALDHYLAFGYVPGALCLLQDVRKLPPAHALLYEPDSGATRVWRYWSLPEPPPIGEPADAERLEEELESLLLEAVRRQLVADVPVGVLLSGGIDSSLVAAMAARVSSQPVRTFNIAFPGYGHYDEGPHARLVAEHFGTLHRQLVAEPATVELLPTLARQFDEPIADSSMVPTFLVSRLVRAEATVALGGDGGDELFGGYPHYAWLQRQEGLRPFVPPPLRRAVGRVASRWLPTGLKGRNYLIGLSADLDRTIGQVNVYFDTWTRQHLLTEPAGDDDVEAVETYRGRVCHRGHSLLRRAMEADFRSTMVDAYLVKVDRAAMLNSLEVRCPWLDVPLVEFAFGRVPDRLKATSESCKILSRRLARRVLPPSLDLDRKQGFSIPLHVWFKGEWGQYMRAVLAEADPALFHRATIDRLLAGQARGFSNMARLYALTFFELWRREYGVSVS